MTYLTTPQSLLSAFLGAGAQLTTVCFLLLGLSMIGILYPEQLGSMYTAGLVIFSLASAVAGAVSARFYKQFGGEQWSRNLVLSAIIFAGPLSVLSVAADLIARYYHSTSALPVIAGIEILLIWSLIGTPLTILGGIAGRRLAGEFSAPVRTKNAPREIPSLPL
jgi:hypothetical protein